MSQQNENREVAIKLSGVKKQYKLGQIGGGTLTADLQSWWARIRGKEDPNTKIGQEQRLVGQTFMALNGIDLTVYKGEALGIIGGNGAGKSTMLKLLSRVTAPTDGEIDINGRIASMLEVGTGFNGELTGRENVYMNGAILGMTKAEIDAKMEDIIEFSEVRDFIDTPVKRYSSGMYVKLAFSVAAHLDSEIMIMDEVLAVGDINFQQKCLKKMRDAAKKEGRTVLYVSHNMNTIRQLCDRCIVLDKGKIEFFGDVETAISIYSNACELKAGTFFDISNEPRKYEATNLCHMMYVEQSKGVLAMNQKLNFSISINSDIQVKNTMFRCVFLTTSGVAIGTAYTKNFRLEKGSNLVKFEFETNCLTPGMYLVDLILVEYNGEIQIRHDIVNKAFAITIDETDILYNMKWDSHGWGNINLSPISIVEEKHG